MSGLTYFTNLAQIFVILVEYQIISDKTKFFIILSMILQDMLQINETII